MPESTRREFLKRGWDALTEGFLRPLLLWRSFGRTRWRRKSRQFLQLHHVSTTFSSSQWGGFWSYTLAFVDDQRALAELIRGDLDRSRRHSLLPAAPARVWRGSRPRKRRQLVRFSIKTYTLFTIGLDGRCRLDRLREPIQNQTARKLTSADQVIEKTTRRREACFLLFV